MARGPTLAGLVAVMYLVFAFMLPSLQASTAGPTHVLVVDAEDVRVAGQTRTLPAGTCLDFEPRLVAYAECAHELEVAPEAREQLRALAVPLEDGPLAGR